MNRGKFLLLVLLALGLVVSSGVTYADTLYTVQSGDTLYAISRRFGVTVQAIAAANNLVNPDLIYPGQSLIIPDGQDPGNGTPLPGNSAPDTSPASTTPGDVLYTVQPGDTLLQIGIRFGVTIAALVQKNNLVNPNLIYAGQTLIIPGTDSQDSTGDNQQPAAPAPDPEPPSPPVGQNLLPNPSFEGGYYNLFGAAELQVPNGWQMEVDEGSAAPGTGITLLRPESRLVPRWELPWYEHALFIWNGDWTIKVFKAHAPTSFRLFTDIYLEPGRYRFVGYYYPDLVASYDSGGKVWNTQPLAGEAAFIGPSGGSWRGVTPGTKNTLVNEFSITAPGVVRLGVAYRTRYAIPNNGFFIDDWSLVQLPN